MRRAPGLLLLVLLVLFLQPATALGVDGDGEVTFEVPLQTNNGFLAKLEADDDQIELEINNKRGQEATYFPEGEVTREGISVKFGPFGEFDADYEPIRTLKSREPGPRCTGEPRTTTEGFFHGTIRFRGERGYVLIEAARVKGTLVLAPPWDCDNRRARASRAPRERDAEEDKATLVAQSQSRRKPIQFLALSSSGGDEKPITVFWALSHEVREGIGISRFTAVGANLAGDRAGFEFDHRRGTAFVDPPAPFGGSARYVRRQGPRDSWHGNLTAPLLGLGRVRLTGPGFRAGMGATLPSFG